jgi:hypothetical protein
VIKLKYHESPIIAEKPSWSEANGTFGETTKAASVESSISLIGQEINLISTDGDPYVNTADIKESLSDDQLKQFIEKAHPIPYGDVLLQYLHLLTEAFKNHTHKYSQMKPVEDITMITLKKFNTDSILSKNIRIN